MSLIAGAVLSGVAKVVEVAAKIVGAVDTAEENKELCLETGQRANRFRNILPIIPDSPLMGDVLTAVQQKLDDAYKLVMACQKKNLVLRVLKAEDLRDQLRQVNIDLTALMVEVFFVATTVQLNSINLRLQEESSIAKLGFYFAMSDAAPKSLPYAIFSFSEMVEATNNFSENNIIRKGRHATVYKGELSDKRVVAIKRFDDPDTKAIDLPFPLQHQNVVDCLGYCHDGNHDMVVEEYMPNGTLSESINVLSEKKDWASTLKIIRGIAEGVAYLHINRVIHLDLKPANIVLDGDMIPKICDFEKSKILHQNDSKIVMEELVGTVGYIAPEYIADSTISLGSDVFSFGVILLYTINRLKMSKLDKHPIVWAWEVREAQIINELENRYMEIGLLCAQEFPQDRPAMSQVIEMLNGMEKLPTPKKPGFVNEINMRSGHTDCATTNVGASPP